MSISPLSVGFFLVVLSFIWVNLFFQKVISSFAEKSSSNLF
jgi:hypothetical protein